MVALHTEGVDRNYLLRDGVPVGKVALHTEGVDRNILIAYASNTHFYVALHTEGVDRNINSRVMPIARMSRPPHGGRG